MSKIEKNLPQIAEELFSLVGGFQDAENELISWPTRNTPEKLTNKRIVSEIYLSKHLQTAVDKTIASNEKLAKATTRHTKVMLWLTGALVFVGLTQVPWTKLF